MMLSVIVPVIVAAGPSPSPDNQTLLQQFLTSQLPGMVIGAGIAFLSQWLLQCRAERQETRRQLMQAYVDLGQVATRELERAKIAEAQAIAFMPSLADDARCRKWDRVWSKLEAQRHDLRARLMQAQFRCGLFERDQALLANIAALAQRQPFMNPGGQNSADFPNRCEKYKQDVVLYEKTVNEVRDRVRQKYAKT